MVGSFRQSKTRRVSKVKPTIEEVQGRIDHLQDQEKTGRLRLALDRLFGITHEVRVTSDGRGFQRVRQAAELPPGPAFESLAEAFCAFTGQPDASRFERVTGIYGGDTFLNALGDTLNKLLLKGYAGSDYRWRDLVSQISNVPNFLTQDAVRVQYIGDLPEVDEDKPYTELTHAADEKVSFTVTTRGGLLVVTRRAVLANDVAGIERAVEQARRAAWRTLAKQVWQKLIANANYDVDGVALFHADHGNLGSAALSVAALNVARKAIFDQAESGGTEKLGLSGPFLLAVPIELEPTAFAIALCDQVEDAANPWRGRFGPQGERIYASPLMTDGSDWILLDISGNAGVIEIGFLGGRQEPQVILANRPSEGQAFTQDRVVYKIMHEYGLTVSDYRGAYKAEVS
jgi:hypothetical protein